MDASTSNTKNKHIFIAGPGVWGIKTIFVNLFFVSEPDGSWVLVDAGVYGYKSRIKEAAADLFGEDSRPKAIILTHGHFDHIGSVKELASEWDVPVYAHPLELPYLTGKSSYPPPDPTVGGGGMSYMAFMYPKKPIDITNYVELLPPDGSVPGLPNWRWLHTPGHTAGHVSLFRESDRTLIAGDAFITRKGESATAVLSQKKSVHGPPSYFTTDWAAAHHSVENLYNLNPQIAATGHGLPMSGPELKEQLEDLVHNFWKEAVPSTGRYIHEPAVTDEQGVIAVPPPVETPIPKVMAVVGVAALAGAALLALSKRSNPKDKLRYKKDYRGPGYSHNRPMAGFPPTVDPDHDDPHTHTNNYP
ncbi:MBL fold metallo-hydrolase [Pontibacter harenae]|uniref:MBL fold metallo-hydrolase n=1 Tax=Pontibacter harenae TaxID=2894083 RepID=UPI001E360A83|nr:MBL fold metallo-hydrolase [Pontibacter harenae]MCC9165757.1 MBL fold metallo-hydrolase [Pontibacter harenae]